MVLAPRKSVILRGDEDDLPHEDGQQDGNKKEKKEEEELGEWHQVRPCHERLATEHSIIARDFAIHVTIAPIAARMMVEHISYHIT